jgi:hypothetical protein
MPGFDRTGPLGKGRLKGRGRGICRADQNIQIKTTDEPSEEKKEVLYGLGRGGRPRGGGGFGNRLGRGFGNGGGRGRGRFSNR